MVEESDLPDDLEDLLNEIKPEISIFSAIMELINLDDLTNSRNVIQKHPELMSDKAEEILKDMVKFQDDNSSKTYLEKCRAFLRQCRKLGVDKAISEFERRNLLFSPKAPEELQSEFSQALNATTQLHKGSSQKEFDDVIWQWEYLVSRESLQSRPDLLSMIYHDLAGVHRQRYINFGNEIDINKCIVFLNEAIKIAPEGSPYLGDFSLSLGIILGILYGQSNDITSLEQSIAAYEKAINFLEWDLSGLYQAFKLIGVSFDEMYDLKQNPICLEKAIDAAVKILEIAPDGSEEIPETLDSVSTYLRKLYLHSGNKHYLQEALKKINNSLEMTEPSSPAISHRLNRKGILLLNLYTNSGNVSNLEEAIDTFRKAKSLAKEDTYILPAILTNLGCGLMDKYNQSWNLEDIDEAIEECSKAVEYTRIDSPNLASRLTNLGDSLRYRYSRKKDPCDLEKSIDVCDKAVSLTNRLQEVPPRAHNLSAALIERYELKGDPSDLDRALSLSRRAIDSTPPGSPDLPSRLTLLGNVLLLKYRTQSDKISDLEEAIESYRDAINCIPKDSPELSFYFSNLGIALAHKHAKTKELSDLEGAFKAFKTASSALDRMFSNSSVIYKLGIRDRWHKIDVLQIEIALQLSQMLGGDSGFNYLKEALVIAEGSKSRLLTELLGRGDFPLPGYVPQELGCKEKELVRELVQIDTQDLRFYSSGLLEAKRGPSAVLEKKRSEIIEELTGLWKHIEELGPEAKEFVSLRRGDRPSWDDIQHLADNAGSQVVLLSFYALPDSIVLFCLRSGWKEPKVSRVKMDLTEQIHLYSAFIGEIHLQRKQGEKGWIDQLKPLIEELAPYLDEANVAVVAPEGFGHLLPWAAVAEKAEVHMSWTTVPALGSLMRLLQRPRSTSSLALVVGNNTDGLIFAEQEARDVSEYTNVLPVLGMQSTKEVTVSRLAESAVAHFASHAHFSFDDPMSTGIKLADGILTARDALTINSRLNLLVLSACQTGISKSLVGDEIAGLTQAFLQAGGRSLLVSLWSINDISTNLLIGKFYRNIMHPASNTGIPMTKAEALLSAQKYVKNLTAKDIIEYCDQRLIRLQDPSDIEQYIVFQYAKANAMIQAGDLQAAIVICQNLISKLSSVNLGLSSINLEWSKDLYSELNEALPLLELKSKSYTEVNYYIKPYESIYYWGPFILVGDWN